MSLSTMLLSDAVIKDDDLGAQEKQANKCSVDAMDSGAAKDHAKAARLKFRVADKLRSAAEREGPDAKKLMLDKASKHQKDAERHKKFSGKTGFIKGGPGSGPQGGNTHSGFSSKSWEKEHEERKERADKDHSEAVKQNTVRAHETAANSSRLASISARKTGDVVQGDKYRAQANQHASAASWGRSGNKL